MDPLGISRGLFRGLSPETLRPEPEQWQELAVTAATAAAEHGSLVSLRQADTSMSARDAGLLARGSLTTSPLSLDLLHLSRHVIGDEGLLALVEAFTSSTCLDPPRRGLHSEGIAVRMAARAPLPRELLNLSCDTITDAGVRVLATSRPKSTFEQLFPEHCGLAGVLRQLRLKRAHLGSNALGERGVLALRQAAPGLMMERFLASDPSRTLDTSLRFKSMLCRIEQRFGLRTTQQLFEERMQDLRCGRFGAVTFEGLQLRPDQWQELARTAVTASTRHRRPVPLRLAKAGMGAKEASLLAAGLLEGGEPLSIDVLDLNSNAIGDEGLLALVAVEATSNLNCLCLSSCGLSSEGVTAWMATSASLPTELLDLSTNPIGDAGVLTLAASMSQSTLAVLYLESCSVTAVGAKALAEALPQSLLMRAYLSDNPLGDEGAQALLQAVPASGVEHLEVRNADCAEETILRLETALQENSQRTFVLQMTDVQCDDQQENWDITYRTLGGAVAAVQRWSNQRPVHEMAEAVLAEIQSTSGVLPFKQCRPQHLRFVMPSGRELNESVGAPPLKHQLLTAA